jgi:protochlorophyllide reductase
LLVKIITFHFQFQAMRILAVALSLLLCKASETWPHGQSLAVWNIEPKRKAPSKSALANVLLAADFLGPNSQTAAFKWIQNWKMPTLQDQLDRRKANDKFADKKLVVITGTSSGLGRKTAAALLRTGQYHVVGAVRDLDKMEVVAEMDAFPPELFTPMHIELNSFESVKKFVSELNEWKGAKHVDRLICNAAVYQPSLPYAKWSADGHEQQIQINYLSHFLLTSLLLEDLAKSPDPRCTFVGSVTGNDNTVGGGGVYPIADLKDLDGLKLGLQNPISMVDGYNFDGAKAYKDSKLCLMMISNLLHDKYHKQTGIAFSAIYPGCIAESPLFREKRAWFRKYFPIFMKYITGGFVGEEEAGMRLFQVAHDPRCSKSGVYWSWNGGPREGRGDGALERDGQISGGGGAGGGWDSIFENDQSDKVTDREKASDLWKYSTKVTGARWPPANQPKSPCPTLKVIGAITQAMNAKEEAKRMTEMPGNVGGMSSKIMAGTAKVTDTVVGGTIGRAAKGVQKLVLGSVPTEALEGSFQEEVAQSPKKRRGLFSRFRRGRRQDEESNVAEAETDDEVAEQPELVAEQRPEELVVEQPDIVAEQEEKVDDEEEVQLDVNVIDKAFAEAIAQEANVTQSAREYA